MAKEEEKTPEHVEKYKKMAKKAEQIIETTAHEHRRAYLTAVEDTIKDKDSGLVDYEKLEKPDIQEAFVKKMADHYVSKAKQTLGGKEKMDEFEEALLTHAYAGVTRHELKQYVGKAGKGFTFEQYEKLHPKFMDKINATLAGAAGQHLKDEHVNDLLKEAKATDYFDAKYISLDQAKAIYDTYRENEIMSEKLAGKIAKQIGIPKAALKKKEEKKAA